MKSAITLQTTSIPEDIIVFEILKRLPAKTLCRFKAVSKRWISIITSRPFIDSHFQHSKLNPKCLFAFYNKDATTRKTLLYDPQSQTMQSYKWDKICRPWPWSISPRGLICLYNAYDPTVQIWNPSTGERMEVNFPPHKLVTKRVAKKKRLATKCYFLLGFDLVSKKHKLLGSINGKKYVFTLGENKQWRKITTVDGSSRNLRYVQPRNCCIDGIIYYLARHYRNDDEFVLVAFDVGSESFLETIRVPGESVHNDNYLNTVVKVYRGRIVLLNSDLHTVVWKMWVLEDVEKQKWSPKRIIPHPSSPSFPLFNAIINGEELLYYSATLDDNANSEGFRLCRYDLENGRWTENRFPNLEVKLDGSARYWVILPCYVDNLESLKKKKKMEKMMNKKRKRATINSSI